MIRDVTSKTLWSWFLFFQQLSNSHCDHKLKKHIVLIQPVNSTSGMAGDFCTSPRHFAKGSLAHWWGFRERQWSAGCCLSPGAQLTQGDLPCGIAEVQTLVLQRGSAFSHSQTYFPREGTEAQGGWLAQGHEPWAEMRWELGSSSS